MDHTVLPANNTMPAFPACLPPVLDGICDTVFTAENVVCYEDLREHRCVSAHDSARFSAFLSPMCAMGAVQ